MGFGFKGFICYKTKPNQISFHLKMKLPIKCVQTND